MLHTTALVRASLKAGWAALYQQPVGQMSLTAHQKTSAIVPIHSLDPKQRARIAKHLLSLSPEDRYLRFGYAVQDEQIQLYVRGLNFARDEVFGIFDRKLALLALAHLAYGEEDQGKGAAEFGVSVLEKARGRGYGKRLFDRAAMQAGNKGVRMMLIHALSENAAMLNIARTAGARVKRDGAESEAYLQLPKASLNSRMTQVIEQRIAEADYQFKLHAKQFQGHFAAFQDERRAFSEAQKEPPH